MHTVILETHESPHSSHKLLLFHQLQPHSHTLSTLTHTYTHPHTAAVLVEFEPVQYAVSEGAPAELIIVLRGQSSLPVTVNLNTIDGSAVGENYTTH